MDPDDRAYVVALAEEVLGAAQRAHRWPYLVDDDGEPLEVDAFWPEHGLAFVVVADPVERWRFAGMLLMLRDVRLLLVLADAVPTDGSGRVLRDGDDLRRTLVGWGIPGSREELESLADGASGGWTSSTTEGPGVAGTGPGVGLEGAYRRADGSWITAREAGQDDPEDGDGEVEIWDGGGGEDEPWLPAWRFERHADDPWGAGRGWFEPAGEFRDHEDEDEDDLDGDFESLDEVGGGWAGEAPVELGWRSRPLVLAALGSVVLARRVLAPGRVGDLAPTSLEVLAVLAVPDDEQASRDLSNARGLAARLALRESTVRGVIEDLVEQGLAQTAGDPEEAVELTEEGRTVVLAWVDRIAPLFGGWAPDREGPDDAS